MQDPVMTEKVPRQQVVEALDNSTSVLFLLGFVTSKLTQIPLLLLSTILGLISLLAYLFGYLIWFCAALFYPHQPRKHAFWYGFARFKDQYQIACILGIIACVVCLIGPAELLLPALWLFNISNLIWSITEFHKLRNPPSATLNPHYSTERQTVYMYYVVSMAASTLVTTISTTIIVVFPQLTLIAMVLSLTLGNMLSIGGFYFLNNTFQDFTSAPCAAGVSHSSYTKLSTDLGHLYINQNELRKRSEENENETNETTQTFSFRKAVVPMQTHAISEETTEYRFSGS